MGQRSQEIDSIGHQLLHVGLEIACSMRKEETMDIEKGERRSSVQVRVHHLLEESVLSRRNHRVSTSVSPASCGAHFRVARLCRAQGQRRRARQGHREACPLLFALF